jgi:hypothetical protein
VSYDNNNNNNNNNNILKMETFSIQVVNDKVVITLAECYNKTLLNLDLSKCSVSDRGILKVAYECSNLIDLRLKQTNVSAIAISYLLNQCKDLKVIFIS